MRRNLKKPPKEELLKEYQKFGSTISSLARIYNTTAPTVRVWLISYDISRKSHKEASAEANNRHRVYNRPSDENLFEVYDNSSIRECSKYFGVSPETLYQWLGDKVKTPSEACKQAKARRWNSIIPTKEQFIQEYEKTKNLTILCDIFGLSGTSIKRLCKEYDIQVVKPWRSSVEIQLFQWLDKEFPDGEWISCVRNIISPYELDIVSHKYKIAIEYCGLYWHGELFKENTYHKHKKSMCLSKGYDLITIFESDDIEKVQCLLKHKIKKTRNIFARKCKVQLIDPPKASIFNENNHLHGHHGGSVHLGLFIDDEQVMQLSMCKSRFNKNFEWECSRMTVKNGVSVIGGASKLFSHFKKHWTPSSIVTYADRRFGEGTVYEKCGFVREKDTEPNYWYYHKNSLYLHSRVKFQKHKLKQQLDVFDESLTEIENMNNNGYYRIFDCGNAKYIWKE